MEKQYTQLVKSLQSGLNDDLSSAFMEDENACVSKLLTVLDDYDDYSTASADLSTQLVNGIRSGSERTPLIDAFLQEYGLSTDEGIILMRLAESLIRTPDKGNAFSLIRDKIESGDWSRHGGESSSFLVDLATLGLGTTKNWIRASGGKRAGNLIAKIGDRALYSAIFRVMQLMGEHYVLGKNITSAISKALRQSGKQDCYSFDMLGEAAHTQADADRYFESYRDALNTIATKQGAKGFSTGQAGLSVKLSALHPRYELSQRDKCVPALVTRLIELAHIAKANDLNITIDAEEAERLEVSLLVMQSLMEIDALSDWNGLGFVVQAYQRRALPLLRHLLTLYSKRQNILNIRLVKGAYWDTEIKRAQEMGLESYPVFTRKENTDVSYLACAKLLLSAPDSIFPRFATHNAHTAAAIITMAGQSRNYEFQRLHGMGETLHEKLKSVAGVASRVYAPVGEHEDLLPYLVRRLLENGANSSFVNQLTSDDISIEDIVADPVNKVSTNINAANPDIRAPRDQFSNKRLAAKGIDFTQSSVEAHLHSLNGNFSPVHAHSIINGRKPSSSFATARILSPANTKIKVGTCETIDEKLVDRAIAFGSKSKWQTEYTPEMRTRVIRKAGDLLTTSYDWFLTLCGKEAGKTWPDAIAEVREAIDFCYYYANQTEDRKPLGVIACISPWNFPLAIFLGQVVGALAAGNSVVCKPAAQTTLIAFEAVKLLHKAGVPKDALHLVLGNGRRIGNRLSAHPDINGICFTGSMETARKIARQVVTTDRAHIPFIAETGGLNAMIVDSTALLEQVVTDVIASAFQSAGQRCSACRVVCIQDDVADDFMEMLSGAMKELRLSDPASVSTDVGPVIDTSAQEMLRTYIETAKTRFHTIHEVKLDVVHNTGFYIGPIAFEIPSITVLEEEIFGPVLHVIRFKESDLARLLSDINDLGYGLTMGLHTRIDDRVEWVSGQAQVGNLYVNRNQIGAVVGVQPFGGEGLSGTGPKAGGPHYVRRMSMPLEAEAGPSHVSNNNKIEGGHNEPNQKIFNLSISKVASKNWFKSMNRDLCGKLIQIFEMDTGSLDPSFRLDRLAMLLEQNFQTELSGPTGEDNTLSLYPRGIIFCDTHMSDPIIKESLLRAIMTGNAVVLGQLSQDRSEMFGALIKPISQITGEKHLIRISDDFPFNSQNIHQLGAIFTTPERINLWAEWGLSLNGPLVPILTLRDEMERFFIERTLSINTTAAGGNATLLAM